MNQELNELMHTNDVSALSRAIDNEENADLRICAARMMGITRNPSTVPSLIGRILDPDPKVRSEIYVALNRLGTPAEAALISALSDTTNPALQASAAEALGELESKTAITELCQELKSENTEVRINAIRALERIEISTPEIKEALILALDDPKSDVVSAAIHAMGCLKCANAVPRIISLLDTTDRDHQFEAVMALGHLGSSHAVMPLLHLLKTTEDVPLSSIILDALGEIRDPIALESLLARLKEDSNHPDDRHRGYSRGTHYLNRIIANFKDSAIQPLIAIMIEEARKNPVPNAPRRRYPEFPLIIENIANIFEKIGSSATEPLLNLLENGNSLVRQWACRCLRYIPDKTAVRSLVSTVVNDPSGEVRAEASKALQPLYSERFLQNFLGEVRADAGKALQRYTDIDVYNLLIAEIQNSKSYFLEEAKWVLTCIGEYHSKTISDCLFDDDATIRSTADSIYRTMITFSSSLNHDRNTDPGLYRRQFRVRRRARRF